MYDFSIICAFLNRENDIKRVIESLVSQKYLGPYEIILIDNGSTDRTLDIVSSYYSRFKNIKFIDASDFKGSPYSARNMGIRKSSGKYIAFIDGYANENWLEEASRKLNNGKIDILAGRVNIEVNNDSSVYQIYDSVFSIDNEKIVKKFRRAPTANLFIKRDIFSKVGLFDENLRSGGDMILTSCAVRNGATIEYSDSVITSYFARDKKAILNKQKRISLAQPLIWKAENKITKYFLKSLIKLFLFDSPYKISKYIDYRSSINVSRLDKLKIYVLVCRLKFMMSYYNWIGLFRS
ncbi:glycosyltransferase [Vibrio cholerae]